MGIYVNMARFSLELTKTYLDSSSGGEINVVDCD